MRIGTSVLNRPKAGRAKARRSLFLRVFGGIVALGLYSAVLVLAGILIFRALDPNTSGSAKSVLRAMPGRLAAVARNQLASVRSAAPLDRLHVDIKFKNLEKLRAKRSEAMQAGVLIASKDDLVPATIRHRGRSVKTKVRLKGDALDHLHGDKWSLRVHVNGSDQLFGMRRFSLQSPTVRGFQAEPIFFAHLRREGVLTPRYQFVDVTLNGKDIGVMALEEHFSKELLESQQRREGVILRFDESAFWNNLSVNGTFGPYGNPMVATLSPFRGGKVAKSPALRADLEAGIGLMRSLMAGRLKPAEVFDVELMARFMAVAEVWRAHHPLAWHNMRFYFNPLTSRFEPVGFDGNLQVPPTELGLVAPSGGFTPLLLADDTFRAAFLKALSRIAGEMADGSIVAMAREIEAELLPQLQEGIAFIEPMHFDGLRARAKSLARIDEEQYALYLPPLGDPDMRFSEALTAYYCARCQPARVELVNALPVPVRAISFELSPTKDAPDDIEIPVVRSDLPVDVPATHHMSAPSPVYIEFDAGGNAHHFEAEVVYRVDGQEERHSIRSQPYFEGRVASPLPSATLEEALSQHDFLRVTQQEHSLAVEPGAWDVEGLLIIPDGWDLSIAPGTELRFEEDGMLISSGALRFEGTSDQPVRLKPQAENETWAGLVSLRSDTPHIWRHVVVESTSGSPFMDGWRLTGGVTLRAAEVQISDSQFLGTIAGDSLNLIRARFELNGVEFRDTISDALDADFSDGVVRGGRYSEIGGDGIDVSGAEVEVDGTLLVDITDKAISVGERSRLTARNVRIERVSFGAASKDDSNLHLEDSFIGNAATAGVAAYTKKPEYGGAQLSVSSVRMDDVAMEVLLQEGSRATVDGTAVAAEAFDASVLY